MIVVLSFDCSRLPWVVHSCCASSSVVQCQWMRSTQLNCNHSCRAVKIISLSLISIMYAGLKEKTRMHVLWWLQWFVLMFILWNETLFFPYFFIDSLPCWAAWTADARCITSTCWYVCANSSGSLTLEQVDICARLKMSGLATHLFRQALNNGMIDLKYRCEFCHYFTERRTTVI